MFLENIFLEERDWIYIRKIWLRIKYYVYTLHSRLHLIFPLAFCENCCFCSNDEFAWKFANKLYRCYLPLSRYSHKVDYTSMNQPSRPHTPPFSPLCIVLLRCNHTADLTAFSIESPRQTRQSIRVESAYTYMPLINVLYKCLLGLQHAIVSIELLAAKRQCFSGTLIARLRVSLIPRSDAQRCRLSWAHNCICYFLRKTSFLHLFLFFALSYIIFISIFKTLFKFKVKFYFQVCLRLAGWKCRRM